MTEFLCGYAPRVLKRLSSRKEKEEVLFVGSKDGSITVLRKASEEEDFEAVKNIGWQPGSTLRKTVRVLLDCGEDLLIVGRDDGSLELVKWRGKGHSDSKPIHLSQSTARPEEGESVRYASWLNRAQDRLLIAYRKAGTRILTFDKPLANEEDLRDGLVKSVALEGIGGIRVAAVIPDSRRPDSPSDWFVLIDQYGALWLWNSRPAGHGQVSPPKRLGEWSRSPLELPVTFEDVTYVGPAPHGVYKDVHALIVATDLGVFALDLREESWQKILMKGDGEDLSELWPRPTRIALPGGNRLCTAVTYSEARSAAGPLGQLWVTNRAGENLLFENKPLGKTDFQTWALAFRSSGRRLIDSQALTAVSWASDERVWLARACRDDRVRTLYYSALRGTLSTRRVTETEFLGLECKPDAKASIRDHLLHYLPPGKHSYDDWPDYALLAEFFDLLGDGLVVPRSKKDHTTQTGIHSKSKFFEYLSQPATEIPVAILVSIASGEDASRHLAAAVRLWTLSLLGLANRDQRPREEWYLGILRFLRGLVGAVAYLSEDHGSGLRIAIEEAIRFTRKWGLYGQVNEVRQNLISPLKILENQHGSYTQNTKSSARLDELTYYSLLLRRSYNQVAEDIKGKKEGDHAWAVKKIDLDCGALVAASWRRQGIVFFVLESENLFSPKLVRLKAPPGLNAEREDPPQGDHDRYNFSRDILLLNRGGNRFQLLKATKSAKNSDLVEDLQLLDLEIVPDKGAGWKVDLAKTVRKLPSRARKSYESIYRFLDLGGEGTDTHLVAAGLGGKNGKGEVALIDLSGSGDLRICARFALSDYGPDTHKEVSSQGLETFRNRVWSLAKLDSEGSAQAFLAGCDNGEIWYVELRGGKRHLCRRVARLTSAVKTLYTASVEGKLRVYAGTKDGTIMAFQELDRRKDEAPDLAHLWATVESDEICYIDRHPYTLDGEDFVLAVTRGGVCLAFDDCHKAAPFKPDTGHPQRPPFPGIRWLRTATGGKSFAATSFASEALLKGIGHSTWRFLATASEDGCLRILSLHFPRYSKLRKDEFQNQCERLWAVSCRALTQSGPDLSLPGDHAFRAVEAAYRSAPLLPLILVRMLLDTGIAPSQEKNRPWLDLINESNLWCLPQNIRPVRELRQLWDHASVNNVSEEDVQEIGKALAAALDAARAGRDIDLFQEICALTLKRLNGQLFQPEKYKAASLRKIYFFLFDIVRGRLQLWLGSPNRGELRTRIVVGKNLLDGDTFYELAQREERQPNGPWGDIIMKRVEGVVELILVGDDLVSLEALRAANHSLIRLCQRLSKVRQSPSEGLRALRWESFRHYFSQLVHGAVQRVDANLRLGDAITHEYSRTFALCLYACPEGLLDISSALVDSRLIRDSRADDDFTRNIQGQVAILADVFDLYGIDDLWKFVERVHLRFSFENLPKDGKNWEKRNRLGRQGASGLDAAGNTRLLGRLKEYGHLYRFVAKLKQFSDSLSLDARDLQLATQSGIRKMIAKIPEEGKRGVFPHSWDFWAHAFAKLKSLEECPEKTTERIRPEAILFIRKIADWAQEAIKDLEQRYSDGRIFEPEHRIFREALGRVERAAGEFPSSATVQNNLVVGILGHHLLEDLDLHVLELREIARNLDPTETIADPAVEDETKSVAARFASLLVRRSQKAQSLPKNLRALAKVIEPSRETISGGFLKELFSEKVWNLNKWRRGDLKLVTAREREYITLIRSELEQNHETHSGFGKGQEDQEKHRFRPSLQWRKGRLYARFPVKKAEADKSGRKNRWELLEEVVGHFGQEPLNPNPSPGVSSTGVGLYLSCLAAAMIGWKLIPRIQPTERDRTLAGHLIIELYPESKNREHRTEIPPVHAGPPRGAPEETIRNVVVIDDKEEVAYYVWRELGETTGFGSAEARKEPYGKAQPWSAPLAVPSGDLNVWWIPATSEWRKHLEDVFKRDEFKQGGSFFLVDVRGPVGGDPNHGKQSGYAFLDVLAAIKSRIGEEISKRVWLISSYEHGIRSVSDEKEPFEIRSKNPETLRQLRSDLLTRKAAKPEAKRHKGNRNPAHVLVTGAGFELQGQPEKQRIGIPSTSRLLEQWLSKAYPNMPIRKPGKFPFPEHLESDEIVKASEDGNLDNYWSALLKTERELAKDISTITRQERELRQKFRDEFLQHDWGFLPQAVAAARLGWAAWVSTNYTRFANRAIDLSRAGWRTVKLGEEAQDPSRETFARGTIDLSRETWRTVEFGEEAQTLSREMLHNEKGLSSERILFKVHGDISHVLTMALSMEDKTEETRLASFLPLYLAAQTYLQTLARESSRITWHIVGHGLRDKLLLHLIKTAYQTKKTRHEFIVVDPAKPEYHPAFELQRNLGCRENLHAFSAKADEYLTRLDKAGGLVAHEEVLQELRERQLSV